MGSCSSSTMLQFLTKSLSSLNKNKLYGLLAEIDFRLHLKKLGFEDTVICTHESVLMPTHGSLNSYRKLSEVCHPWRIL